MRVMRKKPVPIWCIVLASLVLVLAAGALVGCSGTATTTTQATSAPTTAATVPTTEAPTETTAATPTTAAPTALLRADSPEKTQAAKDAALKDAAAAGPPVAPPQGKTIAWLRLSEQSEADVRILGALNKAAGMFGFKVIMYDTNFAADKTQLGMTALLAQNPDIILAEARDPGAMGGSLKDAYDRKIPVIMLGALQTESPYLTAQYVPNEPELTAVLDTWMLEKIEERFGTGPVKIGSLQAPTVGPGVRARDTQRGEDLKAYPNITDMPHDVDMADPIQDSLKQARLWYEQNPNDLAAVWATGDLFVPPVAQAFDGLGLAGDKRPIVCGIYSTKESRALLQTGSVDGVVENNFEEMGWVAVDQALEFWARGKPFAKDNSVFKTGYSIPFLESWMHTPENVDPDVNKIANYGQNYEAYFTTKWEKEFGVAPQ